MKSPIDILNERLLEIKEVVFSVPKKDRNNHPDIAELNRQIMIFSSAIDLLSDYMVDIDDFPSYLTREMVKAEGNPELTKDILSKQSKALKNLRRYTTDKINKIDRKRFRVNKTLTNV